MAKKVAVQPVAPTASALVTCMKCEHSCLHRYGNDPILSACHSKPQPGNSRFPFEVEVASVPRRCVFYHLATKEKTVEQREKEQIA